MSSPPVSAGEALGCRGSQVSRSSAGTGTSAGRGAPRVDTSRRVTSCVACAIARPRIGTSAADTIAARARQWPSMYA